MKNSRLKARSFFDWRPILSPGWGGKGTRFVGERGDLRIV